VNKATRERGGKKSRNEAKRRREEGGEEHGVVKGRGGGEAGRSVVKFREEP
jgi:hypothetical protein